MNNKKETTQTILNGLILTGGKSSRMGEDKASISINGKNQTHKIYKLLTNHCNQIFISCRKNQWNNRKDIMPSLKKIPPIFDEYDDVGPLGGILSAMKRYPNSAWLIVACDLFLLDDFTLKNLVNSRNTNQYATAYKSTQPGHENLPEPLCAIYEPKIYQKLSTFLSKKILCPRKILINLPTELLTLKNNNALKNFNFKHELESFIKKQSIC